MTIRKMLDLMPHGKQFSDWIMVTDATGKLFYGHRDDIPEWVAELPVARLKVDYVWEPNMFDITINTWKRMVANDD